MSEAAQEPEEGTEPMMKIIAEQALLADIADALDPLVIEANFQWLPGRLRIWEVDPANVASVYIDLNTEESDQIQHYSVQDGGFKNGLKLSTLDNLLGYADADDLVQVEFSESHNWRYHFDFPQAEADVGGIDPDSMRNPPDRPSIDWPAQFTLSGESFKDAVDLNNMFSDHHTIRAGDGQVQFVAEGDTDGGTFTLEEGEGELEFHQHPDSAQEAIFSLDYMGDISKPLKNVDQITMHVSDNHPVLIEADLFEYILAPRIDTS